MTGPARLGLVGLGEMGLHHLRNLGEMESVDLIAVVEPDPAARRRATVRGVAAVGSLGQLVDLKPDAAVVAVPTAQHAAVAVPLLEAGIACLVEKPLAGTVADAEAIVAAAGSGRSLLAVGHIERHNPAVAFLAGLIARGEVGEVLGLSVYRTGPMPARIRDVGVVFDLASHDLDIVCWLLGQQPAAMQAHVFGWTANPRREAAVHIVARFGSGVLATVDASWLHPAKSRRLHCLGTEGLVTVDYLQQEVRLTRNNHELGDWGPLVGLGASLGEQIRYSVQRREPLRAELESFVAAVRGDDASVVPGAAGLAVVRLLAELTDQIAAQGGPGGSSSPP